MPIPDPRTALTAIGQLPDAEIDIADAALQLARVDAPDADWETAREHLSDLARQVVDLAGNLPADDLPSRAIVLSGLLGGRYGYTGDVQTYDDLANANLISVIARRRGLPVALGVIWLHAARAAGWHAHGVDFPAHFLVALERQGSQAILDVFNGGAPLSSRDLKILLRQVEGEGAELRPGLLRPMGARRVLLRLQNNIMSRRLQVGDIAGALACADDMLRIAPAHAELWRQAGALNQRLDCVSAALQCYKTYLDLVPEGGIADKVRRLVGDLRSRLN